MNKNTKIGVGLFMLICGVAVMGSLNRMEGMENGDKNKRSKCIKPSSLDGNCGQVMKNKKGLSYKACPGYCEDPEDCYDDDCEKYGLIIKEDKNGNYKVASGPIDMSEIDTVSNSNISNWPVVKNGDAGKPYPRGHAHGRHSSGNDGKKNNKKQKGHDSDNHNHYHKKGHHNDNHYHTDDEDEDEDCY